MVCQNNYEPKREKKWGDLTQFKYSKKNWSSLMMFNNSHQDCKKLTSEYVNSIHPLSLHQFEWTGIYEEKFPKVTQWYANCRARQSYKEAVIAEVPQSTFEALGRKGRESWPKIKLHLPS